MTEQEFRGYYDIYVTLVFHHAYKILDDRRDIEEAVSEAFIELWKCQRRVVDIKSFLAVVVRNKAKNILKIKQRRQKHENRMADMPIDDEEYEDITPLFKAVMEAVKKLPPKMKIVLEKMFLEEKKPREIAQETGMSYMRVLNNKTDAIRKKKKASQ